MAAMSTHTGSLRLSAIMAAQSQIATPRMDVAARSSAAATRAAKKPVRNDPLPLSTSPMSTPPAAAPHTPPKACAATCTRSATMNTLPPGIAGYLSA